MANLPVPSPLTEVDYEAIEAAVMETARGRWFLAEYARRNRNAETRPLLTAIERLQISLAADPAALAEVLVKQKLRALLDDINTAQNEIEASVMAIRTAKLADLIAMVEQRLVEIMAPAMSSPAPREPLPPPPPEEPAEEARARLAVVPADPLAGCRAAATDRAGPDRNGDGGNCLRRAST